MSRVVRLGFFLGLILSGTLAHAEFRVPALTSPVMDQAGMMNGDAVEALDATLRDLRAKGGPQINVLTVDSLEGLPIESASIKVTDAWKLGGAKKDDGVLLLVAKQDRRLRIEVGQGLEGDLTDLESSRIIEEQILPYFRAGRPSDGIIVGVRAIIAKTAPDYLKNLGEAPAQVRRTAKHRSSGIPLPLIILLLVIFSMLSRLGRGRRSSGLMGALAGAAIGRGLSGGRGGFGGGGGGSSWGGGGGGFSGGGASGSW